MVEGGTAGVIFKWINKNEIMKKHESRGKTISLQSYINKLHIEYIATRPGTVINTDINHGIFGNIYGDNGELLDLEDLTLKEITNKVGERSKKNIDIFKTVFSMKEEDVLRYGMDKTTWKDIITKRITDIAKASKIPPESIEWSASFHSKKNNPHCHLVFWNKDQNLELNKKPFLNFKDIRKAVSKEIFKEELEKLYDIKNISKKTISNFSKEELKKYKDKLKEELKNPDLNFNEIDTDNEENMILKYTDKLNVGEKIYLYNKFDPETFVEIEKSKEILNKKYYGNEINEEKNILKFKNNGDRAILYKNDDFTDTACFLSNFREIKIAYSKEELENIIKEKKDKELKIDNELREIMPSIIPNNILSNEFRDKSFNEITKRISNLRELIKQENKEATGKEKITFRYDLQQSNVKKEIDKISILLLNTSKDCKLQFNQYISSSLDIARYLSDIENKNDYERVKNRAKDEVFNKIGNQILQFLKENINENYEEEWNKRKEEYKLNGLIYKLKQEEFEQQMKNKEVKNLINNIFKDLNTNNIYLKAKDDRLKANFNNMTKEQIREFLKMKENSSGFEWFN